MDLEQSRVATNGVSLHTVTAGPADGPLVVLLHGFPEYWRGWRHQVGPLARAGYRVLAPDQRGYNLSDKPAGVAAYAVDVLVEDIVGLLDACGRDAAVLVGHDWGGAVAWWTALRHPDRLSALVLLNMPHPSVMARHLRRSPRQMLRSSYGLFIQLPWLPEALLRWRRGRLGVRALCATSRLGAFSARDLEAYRRAWLQPGALTGMLNWYRAALRHPPELPSDSRVRVPTLMLWGARDPFLGRETARPSIDLCDRGRLVVLEEATHWLHHEEPERVNALLTRFLSSEVPSPG